MITGCNDQMGCITNIAAGIVGAIVGAVQFLRWGVRSLGQNWWSLLMAVVGAVVVLAIVNLIFGRRNT
jgi:uncharacterized membrane protein YeaQ/YmgE (transglycosylase-associated protein family)